MWYNCCLFFIQTFCQLSELYQFFPNFSSWLGGVATPPNPPPPPTLRPWMPFRKPWLRVKLVNFDFGAKSSSTDYNKSNKLTPKSLAHIRSEKSLVELRLPKNELFHFFTFFAPLKSLLFTLGHGYCKKKVLILSIVLIPNCFDTCHHTAHNISHHTHTICKRAELKSKTYKNGLFKKKSVQKSKNPYLYWQIRTSGNTGRVFPSTLSLSPCLGFPRREGKAGIIYLYSTYTADNLLLVWH